MKYPIGIQTFAEIINKGFLLLCLVVFSVSCIRPALVIPDTLELQLRGRDSYRHYVKLVNQAMAKDTIALRELLMIDDIGDAAIYEHGDILIQLLENLGDEHYSKVLSSIPAKQKEVFLQGYFLAGMDVRKPEYKIRIDKEYPITFNELDFDEGRKRVFLSISGITVVDDSLSETLHQHCSLWLNSWERELKTDSFALTYWYTSSPSAHWEKFDISEKSFSDYQDKICYSPNGSYALDLYSYNLILNKNGAKIYAESDADTQIYLIDIPHHQRLPILFLGPSESIDDGYWLSDSTVVLVGWKRCFDCLEEAYTPFVSKVNVFTGKTVGYCYKSGFSHYNKDYLKQKFPKIIFDF